MIYKFLTYFPLTKRETSYVISIKFDSIFVTRAPILKYFSTQSILRNHKRLYVNRIVSFFTSLHPPCHRLSIHYALARCCRRM